MSTFIPYEQPEIPLYTADETFLAFITTADVQRYGSAVEVKRSRRGHIRRANLRGTTAHAVRMVSGGNKQSFEQSVRSGRVWALKGVTGS